MKKSKLFVLAMTALISIGALTGCGGGSDNKGGRRQRFRCDPEDWSCRTGRPLHS